MIKINTIASLIFACVIGFFSIRYIYVDIFYVKFAYMGFTLKESRLADNVVSAFFLLSLIIAGFLLPKKIDSAGRLLTCLCFFVIYMPTLALLPLITHASYEEVLILFFVLTLCYIMLVVFSINNSKVIRITPLPKKLYLLLFFTMLFFSFLIVIKYYNFSISSILSLTDISGLYDIREDFRDQNDEIPKIAVYALTISAKVFIPCLLLYGILIKHKLIIILSFAMQVILFLITGQKSLFLGWLLILGFCLYMRNKETLKIYIVANFISFIFLFSIVLYWLGSEALLIFVVRRIFIMPGVLGAYYFDFYLNHPYALLSYSFMSAFFENIYNATPPFVIGMNYFSRSGMSANVNFLMSAFADFSYIGMVLYTLILCMIYKFLDLVIDFKSNIRLLSVMLLPTWALLDSSMTTVLLTHGLLVTIMLILFCPIKKVFK